MGGKHWRTSLVAGASLGVLWVFHVALFGFVVAALPESRDLPVTRWALGLGTAWCLATAGAYPWLLDRLLKPQWIDFQAAGDVGPFLRQVLERNHVAIPRLGVMVDADPLVLSYGLTPARARLVVSSGLLRMLDVDEQSAILCHEAAHLRPGELAITTLFAAPIMLLRRSLLLLARSQELMRGGALGTGALIAPVMEAVVHLHERIYGALARCREADADDFARENVPRRSAGSLEAHDLTQDGPEAGSECSGDAALPEDPLSRALLRVAFGLGRPLPTPASTTSALRGFLPVDALAAARVATWSACGGVLSLAGLAATFRSSSGNPYASSSMARIAAGLSSTRPETAEGLETGEARRRFKRKALLARAPFISFVTGSLMVYAIGGYWGIVPLAWSLGRLVYILGEFVGQRSPLPPQGMAPLVAAGRPWGAAFRVVLGGHLLAYGVPGKTRCPDPVIRVAGLFLPVRLRPLMGSWQHFGLLQKLALLAGKSVQASGWLHLDDVPYLELHRLEHRREVVYNSYYVPLHLVVSLILGVLGILVILTEWMGV
jgi:hypothetical protein